MLNRLEGADLDAELHTLARVPNGIVERAGHDPGEICRHRGQCHRLHRHPPLGSDRITQRRRSFEFSGGYRAHAPGEIEAGIGLRRAQRRRRQAPGFTVWDGEQHAGRTGCVDGDTCVDGVGEICQIAGQHGRHPQGAFGDQLDFLVGARGVQELGGQHRLPEHGYRGQAAPQFLECYRDLDTAGVQAARLRCPQSGQAEVDDALPLAVETVARCDIIGGFGRHRPRQPRRGLAEHLLFSGQPDVHRLGA